MARQEPVIHELKPQRTIEDAVRAAKAHVNNVEQQSRGGGQSTGATIVSHGKGGGSGDK